LFQGATIALYSTEALFAPLLVGGADPARGTALSMASLDIPGAE
jgi:hypothetical protein